MTAPCEHFVGTPSVCRRCGCDAVSHEAPETAAHLLSRAEQRTGARVVSADELGRVTVGSGSTLTAQLVQVERGYRSGTIVRSWRVVLVVQGPTHRRAIQLRPRELRQAIAWLVAGAARVPAEVWATEDPPS